MEHLNIFGVEDGRAIIKEYHSSSVSCLLKIPQSYSSNISKALFFFLSITFCRFSTASWPSIHSSAQISFLIDSDLLCSHHCSYCSSTKPLMCVVPSHFSLIHPLLHKPQVLPASPRPLLNIEDPTSGLACLGSFKG